MCYPCTVGDNTTVNADVITLNYFKADNQHMSKHNCTPFHYC